MKSNIDDKNNAAQFASQKSAVKKMFFINDSCFMLFNLSVSVFTVYCCNIVSFKSKDIVKTRQIFCDELPQLLCVGV